MKCFSRRCAAAALRCSTSHTGVLLSATPTLGGGSLHAQRRWQAPNPVNVELFTLNPEIVELDMKANEKWNELSKRMGELRGASGDVTALREAIKEAFALLEEVGEDRSPMQCRIRLNMELAQVELANNDPTSALTHAVNAHTQLSEATGAARDPCLLAEARELIGFIRLKLGLVDEAEATFRELLQWVDLGSSREAPMVRVAAKGMRRTVCTGLGEALLAKARKADEPKVVAKQALDFFIPALAEHVDENDFLAGKRTLFGALDCFILAGDNAQAVETCGRIDRWCSRFNDEAGIEAAKAILATIPVATTNKAA